MNAHNTISNLLLDDDTTIELIENSEKEENRENELKEEFKFISNLLSIHSNLLEKKCNLYQPYYIVNSYNSPIQPVITPPPNTVLQ